jgi:Zn-finger nucleic acid-binding protein
MTYLNCPLCHLSLRAPRAAYMAPEHCPRCIGRRRMATRLFASELPMRQLIAQQAPPEATPPPRPAE